SIEIDGASMVIRRVEVEEQHVFRPESFELVGAYLPDSQARNPGHITEPEPFLLNQSPQLDGGAAGVGCTQGLIAPCRPGNSNVGRLSDRYEMREQRFADKRHVAGHDQRPFSPGMNGGIQPAQGTVPGYHVGDDGNAGTAE